MTVSGRIFAVSLLAVCCLFWAAAATHGWWMERLASVDSDLFPLGPVGGSEHTAAALDVAAPVELPPGLFWAGGDAARRWTRRLMSPRAGRLGEAEAVLEAALDARPLYAPTWLDLAELQQSAGRLDDSQRAVDIAVALWPGRPRLLRRAAWMRAGLDSPRLALAALMDYWAFAPQDSLPTLALARRLSPSSAVLVNAAEQVWERDPGESVIYQRELLGVAGRAGDLDLARELWERLDAGGRRREELLFPYLQLLMAHAEYATADAVWQQALGDPPGIINGGFEEPLTPLGADFRPGWATPGWRFRADSRGFSISRDTEYVYAGRHSLAIAFAGTENVNLAEPSQIVRVRPGRRYRLHGAWSADGLTTRSGVFLEIGAIDGPTRVRVQTAPRWGTWDWERFELEIQVPEDCLRLAVRARRVPTTALDRLLGGTLWLDELVLEPMP